MNWPGTEKSWKCKHSDTSQGILARMEIYAATHIDRCGDGGVFNIADSKTVTWEDVWPKLCADFGLIGEGPASGSVSMEQFVKTHNVVWKNLAERYGLKEDVIEEQNWPFVHFMLVQFDFDRQYDLSHSRQIGFNEEIDTVGGYVKAWEKMRRAKILPPK